MKKIRLVLICILTLASLFAFRTVQASDTYVFAGLTQDITKEAGGVTYSDAWNASSGSGSDGAWDHTIGQSGPPELGGYAIDRTFLFFNTSTLPNDAEIEGAVLSFVLGLKEVSGSHFNLTIQNGQPTYPHFPVQNGDYAQGNYSGDGGSLPTTNMKRGQWNELIFNINGYAWINKTGLTKLCLRSDRDINAVPATGWEYIQIDSAESPPSGNNAPKLVVDVHDPDEETGDIQPWSVPSEGDGGGGDLSDAVNPITVDTTPTTGLFIIGGIMGIIALGGIAKGLKGKKPVYTSPKGRSKYRSRLPQGGRSSYRARSPSGQFAKKGRS